MLSVRQPWADLLVPDADVVQVVRNCAGDAVADALPKGIENRSRTHSWRGWIVIHASGWPRYDRAAMDRLGGLHPGMFRYGAVVGVARLVDTVPDAADWPTATLLNSPPDCSYCGQPARDCQDLRATQLNGHGCCRPCDTRGDAHIPPHPRGMWAQWGAVHWEIADPIRLADPITGVRGALGLLPPPDDVLATVLQRLDYQLEGST
jgi:hypothetical protein